MARLARLYVPDQPQHVILRGLDQQPAFVDDQDYELFIDCLKAASRDHHLSIHAYALMPGAVQLLARLPTRAGHPALKQHQRPGDGVRDEKRHEQSHCA